MISLRSVWKQTDECEEMGENGRMKLERSREREREGWWMRYDGLSSCQQNKREGRPRGAPGCFSPLHGALASSLLLLEFIFLSWLKNCCSWLLPFRFLGAWWNASQDTHYTRPIVHSPPSKLGKTGRHSIDTRDPLKVFHKRPLRPLCKATRWSTTEIAQPNNNNNNSSNWRRNKIWSFQCTQEKKKRGGNSGWFIIRRVIKQFHGAQQQQQQRKKSTDCESNVLSVWLNVCEKKPTRQERER